MNNDSDDDAVAKTFVAAANWPNRYTASSKIQTLRNRNLAEKTQTHCLLNDLLSTIYVERYLINCALCSRVWKIVVSRH